MEILQNILFPTQFIPHGHCYLWQPELVWLHLLSDVLIAIAYYSIPIALVYFVRKREDIPFPGIFLLFGLFIVTCGTTHLMSVWTLWHPAYWLSGTIKAITATVSIYTALMLFPTLPAALALPSPDDLRRINQQLEIEIEERKQAEVKLQLLNQELETRVEKRTASLQESEGRWRSFLDNVRLMVVGVDCLGQVEYVNPYAMSLMGNHEEDVMGKNWFKAFVPPHQQQHSRAMFQTILEHDKRPYYQSDLVTPTGDKRVIAWYGTLLKDAQGQPTGVLSLGEDITERYAIDRMKDEFISVVSHELRTPLTSIHGALDLLTSGLVEPDSDRGHHVLSIAAENSSRLVQLVNDILELERLESGKVKLHQASVSTLELTQRAYELMELMAERANIQLEITELDLLIWADGDRLIQVLTNLLSNAIKFSEPSSTVGIVVEDLTTSDGKYVKFSVTDHGRGIPSNKLEYIFERFHQVDASDSRSKGGTGLGLAICSSIVQQHGGTIWVESLLGEGSCFSFTVPSCRQTDLKRTSNIKN